MATVTLVLFVLVEILRKRTSFRILVVCICILCFLAFRGTTADFLLLHDYFLLRVFKATPVSACLFVTVLVLKSCVYFFFKVGTG